MRSASRARRAPSRSRHESSAASGLRSSCCTVPSASSRTKRRVGSAYANHTGTPSADAHAARLELDALVLFKRDIATYVRLYGFLSQIFNYGNTDIEKRFLFYKRLTPLLDFGRERDAVDLSKVVLTHHNLKNKGRQALDLQAGEAPRLAAARTRLWLKPCRVADTVMITNGTPSTACTTISEKKLLPRPSGAKNR